MEPTGFFAKLRLRFQRMKLQWMVWVVNFNASRQLQFFKGVRTQWRGAKKRFGKLSIVGKLIVLSAIFGFLFLLMQWLRKRRNRGREREDKEVSRERKYLLKLETRIGRHFRPRHPSEPPVTYLRRAARYIASDNPSLIKELNSFADRLSRSLYHPVYRKEQVVALRREAKNLSKQIRNSGVRPLDEAQSCPPPPDVVVLKRAS